VHIFHDLFPPEIGTRPGTGADFGGDFDFKADGEDEWTIFLRALKDNHDKGITKL
jgi:hypothetical protein